MLKMDEPIGELAASAGRSNEKHEDTNSGQRDPPWEIFAKSSKRRRRIHGDDPLPATANPTESNIYKHFSLPTFGPPPLRRKLRPEWHRYTSTHPTSMQIPNRVLTPADIEVPSVIVPFKLRYVIVPKFFVQETDPFTDEDIFDTQGDPSFQTTSISVEPSTFNTAILAQTYLGFSPSTAAFFMERLHNSAIDPSPHAVDGKGFRRASAVLQRSVLSLSLYGLMLLLNNQRTWTFTLVVEGSPYHGFTGLLVSVCVHMPEENKFQRAHVYGITDPADDVPRLSEILHNLCPDFSRKLLAVSALLSTKGHAGLEGAAASQVISHFFRLMPRKSRLLTPDDILHPRPPLLPCELAASPHSVVTALVNRFQSRLLSTWDAEVIPKIEENHNALCREISSKSNGPIHVGNIDWESFSNEWAPYTTRYDVLYRFIGGLATAYLYKPDNVKVSITCIHTAGSTLRANHIATEIVLHTRQFIQLCPILLNRPQTVTCPDGPPSVTVLETMS